MKPFVEFHSGLEGVQRLCRAVQILTRGQMIEPVVTPAEFAALDLLLARLPTPTTPSAAIQILARLGAAMVNPRSVRELGLLQCNELAVFATRCMDIGGGGAPVSLGVLAIAASLSPSLLHPLDRSALLRWFFERACVTSLVAAYANAEVQQSYLGLAGSEPQLSFFPFDGLRQAETRVSQRQGQAGAKPDETTRKPIVGTGVPRYRVRPGETLMGGDGGALSNYALEGSLHPSEPTHNWTRGAVAAFAIAPEQRSHCDLVMDISIASPPVAKQYLKVSLGRQVIHAEALSSKQTHIRVNLGQPEAEPGDTRLLSLCVTPTYTPRNGDDRELGLHIKWMRFGELWRGGQS